MEQNGEKTPEQAIDEELKALADALEKGGEAEQKPAEQKPADPAEPSVDEGRLIDEAAINRISSWDEARRREALSKQFGYDLTPKKEIADGEKKVAEAATKITADQFLQKYDAMVSPNELPEGFDQLDPFQQDRVKTLVAAHKLVDAAKESALQPYKDMEAAQAHQATIAKTAKQWATDLGKPGAEEAGRNYLSNFGPQHVAMYEQEASNGGGPFMDAVQAGFRQALDSYKAPSQEVPLMKSEQVGGKDAEADGYELSGPTKAFYDKAMADPKLSKEDKADMKKSLSRVKF